MQKKDIINSLKRFKELNSSRYNIVKIGLFGSVAGERFDQESYIDIVVVLSKPDMFNLIGIKQDLEEEFQRHVDIVRYRERMNPFLRRRIEREVIYV
jgi:hypothetical protein